MLVCVIKEVKEVTGCGVVYSLVLAFTSADCI